MRKRLAALFCTAALLGALTAALAAPAPSAMEVRTWQGEIWVNGVQMRFQNEKGEEVPLFSCGGTVYIPLHTAGEWLGCTVRWSREDRTVALTGGGTPCYRNGPGNAAAHASGVAAEICPDIAVTLNGVPVEFSDGNGDPVYPAVLGESVYLPARGVGALCGLSAAWRPDSAVHPGGAVYLRLSLIHI